MNRDPYGRGGAGDADPYQARRQVADRPGRPDPRGQAQPGQARRGQYPPGPAVQGRPPRRQPSHGEAWGGDGPRGDGRRDGWPGQAPRDPARRDRDLDELRPRSHRYRRNTGAGGEDGSQRPSRPVMPLWQELPLLLIVAFCLAVLIRTFLLQAFFIPSGSMQYTLEIKDRVLVNKMEYNIRQPAHGEVIVFRGTDNWAPEAEVGQQKRGFLARLGHTVGDLVGVSEPSEKDFIKRVIGLPGDTVKCCDAQGRVTVNGYALDEPYVTDNSPLEAEPTPGACGPRRFGPVTVPPGKMWVMGDHRAVSQDSRCQGPVPIKNVIGRAFVIVWPTKHWASLPVPKTFEKVPRPVAAAPAPGRPGAGGPGAGASGGRPVWTASMSVGERHREVPQQESLFDPFVWILSDRRVQGVGVRLDNVGSAS